MSSDSVSSLGDDENNHSLPLFSQLARDLSGKRTVNECLRSKITPSPEVEPLIATVTSTDLTIANATLLASYLHPLKQNTEKESSLWYISRMGTVTRYMELLFELCTSKSSLKDEASKQLKRMIPVVTSVAADITNENGNEDVWDSDATETFDGSQVCAFMFGSLLRLDYYVRNLPAFLSVFYKGLCHIASKTKLPTPLTQRVLRCLVTYMQEGLFPILEQKETDQNTLARPIKILCFLVTRLPAFAPLTSEPLEVLLIMNGLSKEAFGPLVAKANEILQDFLNSSESATQQLIRVQGDQVHYKRLAWGKINLILKRLESNHDKNGTNLSLLQDLIMVSLPICMPLEDDESFEGVLEQVVARATELLHDNKEAQWRLVSWMSHTLHPLSQQIVLELAIQQHASMGQLFVDLLFDERTCLNLRRNVALVLRNFRVDLGTHYRQLTRKRKRSVPVFLLEPVAAVLSALEPESSNPSCTTISTWPLFTSVLAYSASSTVTLTQLSEAIDFVAQALKGRPLDTAKRSWMDSVVSVLVLRSRDVLRKSTVTNQDVTALTNLYSVLIQQDGCLPLLASVSAALEELGTHVAADLPRAAVTRIAACFRKILSSQNWTIRSFALTALVKFAAAIPNNHKQCLPQCVPSNMQKRLEYRLKGRCNPSNVDQAKKELEKELHHLVRDNPVTDGCKSLKIEKNSYVMNMPTQEGRSALVIFPPGEQSLRDIRFMLQLDEGEEVNGVDRAHFARVEEEGICKFFLE